MDDTALNQELQAALPEMELREQEPMSRHTSFRTGGPARLMALPRNEEEAINTVSLARQAGYPVVFMGNGTNLLVSDQGLDALVVKTSEKMTGVWISGLCRITAECGAVLSRIANFAMEHSLGGLEFAHGIPGTVGGAVTMNAGAYGGEMSQVVTVVRHLNADGTVETWSWGDEELEFGYRHSSYSDGQRLILSVELLLPPGDQKEIRDKMEDLRQQRSAKQPLEYPSAGSTFKRPTGYYAGALIDQCGLRGTSVGGAQVSEKHAGFIINKGGATSADILALIRKVQETVKEQAGVMLETEVKLLGF